MYRFIGLFVIIMFAVNSIAYAEAAAEKAKAEQLKLTLDEWKKIDALNGSKIKLMTNLKRVKVYAPSAGQKEQGTIQPDQPTKQAISGEQRSAKSGSAVDKIAVNPTGIDKAKSKNSDSPPTEPVKGGQDSQQQEEMKTKAKAAATGTDANMCIPVGSKLLITSEDQLNYQFFVVNITDSDGLPISSILPLNKIADTRSPTLYKDAITECKNANSEGGTHLNINEYTTYEVSKEYLAHVPFKRAGIRFGALTVPFKYRLGGDRKIITSPVIAPYVAYQTGIGYTFGLNFTPLISAGVTTIKVADTDNKEREIAAFSAGAGFRVNSTADERFGLGVLIGKDFVSSDDKAKDSNLTKPWMSLYVSYDLGK